MIHRISLIVLILYISLNAFSQKTLKFSTIEEINRDLQEHLEVFVDTSNQLDINDILSDSLRSRFRPLHEGGERTSLSHSYWMRFRLSRDPVDGLSIGLQIPWINHVVNVYSISDGDIQIRKTGFYVKSSRNDEVITFTNIIEVASTQGIEYLIQIKNMDYLTPDLGLSFVDLKKEFSRKNRTDIFESFLQGILFLMLLYGLFLYFHNRDKVYLYYSLYIIFISIWCLFYLAFQIAYDLPRMLYNYSMIFIYLALFFYLRFVRSFINAPETIPQFNRVLKGLEVFILIATVVLHALQLLSGFTLFIEYIYGITTGLIVIFIIILIIKVYIADIRFSKFIWVGTSLLMIGTILSLLMFFLVDDRLYTAAKVGSLLELIVFTYGISLRYKILEDEKQQVQGELIEQLRVNASIQEEAKNELEAKVVERTAEIYEKNRLLQQQHHSITESIQYAKQIQSGMLPPLTFFSEVLNEAFVFYKPRDIVSGDFYWIKQVNQYVVLTAADCTGHGVPGALMSMLGISSLNEIVQRREITQANEILNELRYQIKRSLRQHGQLDESRDGMDMALCVIDMKSRIMQYAGAYNPLYLIKGSDAEPELVEIKADRMPVGYFTGKDKSFTNHEIKLDIGDTFYLFSDGFADQIGGPENKKFMSKRFKALLLDIHDQAMHHQEEVLDRTLAEWTGQNPQLDDVIVIGVRI